jgi:excisionase family DNA binding protein
MIRENKPSDGAERLLLRGGEVAAKLGISRAQAFRWMKLGVLPVVRVAGARTVRVPSDALKAWVEDNTLAGLARGARS